MGGVQAPRSDSAGETFGFRAAREALASNCGWSSVHSFQGLLAELANRARVTYGKVVLLPIVTFPNFRPVVRA